MNLALDEAQTLLVDSLSRFLRAQSNPSRIRAAEPVCRHSPIPRPPDFVRCRLLRAGAGESEPHD